MLFATKQLHTIYTAVPSEITWKGDVMLCRKFAMTACMVQAALPLEHLQAALLSGHLQAAPKLPRSHQEAQLANEPAAQLTNPLMLLISVLRRSSVSLAAQPRKLDTMPFSSTDQLMRLMSKMIPCVNGK